MKIFNFACILWPFSKILSPSDSPLDFSIVFTRLELKNKEKNSFFVIQFSNFCLLSFVVSILNEIYIKLFQFIFFSLSIERGFKVTSYSEFKNTIKNASKKLSYGGGRSININANWETLRMFKKNSFNIYGEKKMHHYSNNNLHVQTCGTRESPQRLVPLRLPSSWWISS